MIHPLLKRGQTIGVFAPSSHVEREAIEIAQTFMEARGYKVIIHPQTFARYNQSAGTPEQKLKAFNDLWHDPGIHAIWAAGGGNRAMHWVDLIDFQALRQTPKALIGFSDVTAILNNLCARAGIISYHGPTFGRLPKYEQMDHLLALLADEKPAYPMDGAKMITQGKAQGPLIGGNLSVFQYMPALLGHDFLNGAILFLEDCQEELSRIDRMLFVMRRSGLFDKCAGIIFGSFDPIPETGKPFGFTLDDIIREHTHGLSMPVVMNAPFGHAGMFYTYPLGATAMLETSQSFVNLTLR